MHDMVARGKALYWARRSGPPPTSRQAWHIAERHGLHKPVTEQPQYNLLHRDRVEEGIRAPLCRDGPRHDRVEPLASGLLTGKYNDGIPPGSRGTVKGYEWLAERLTDPRSSRS